MISKQKWESNESLGNEQYHFPPVEEEKYFEINANTRQIEIPDEFQNLVAVQGDNLAEVIWFKIQRYYDLADFNDMNIAIIWESERKTGTYVIEKDELDSFKKYVDDDYLYFGWPISARMTEKVGYIRFAVRLYKIQETPVIGGKTENKNIYSYNTIPAKLNIEQGIGIKENTFVTCDKQSNKDWSLILERLNMNKEGEFNG